MPRGIALDSRNVRAFIDRYALIQCVSFSCDMAVGRPVVAAPHSLYGQNQGAKTSFTQRRLSHGDACGQVDYMQDASVFRRATTVYSEGTWFTTFAHLFHDSLDNEPLAVWVLGRRGQKGSARLKQATTPHPHCQATFAA